MEAFTPKVTISIPTYNLSYSGSKRKTREETVYKCEDENKEALYIVYPTNNNHSQSNGNSKESVKDSDESKHR
jgi:hypothetical protein